MARVTVEDCLEKEGNRFALTILAAERARQLAKGAHALIRCDNKPAWLFPERYAPRFEGSGKRFLPLARGGLDPALPRLAAVVDPSPSAPPQIYKARWGSMDARASNAGALSIPDELDDGNDDTSWVSTAGGDGQGEQDPPEGPSPRAPAVPGHDPRASSAALMSAA